ncbi:MAG: hypothetical protein JWO58_1685 [Chitinophagaceae bacterium]|nr:hypothetical protein [Chitinophagaceae bacterium]
MVNLFKLFDLPRVILLLLLTIAYAVFSDIAVFPMTSYELMNIVTSEHLTGGNTMYKDVFHWTEPLTVGVQYFFFQLFGRDVLYYRIVALILVFFQALLWNQTLNEKGCYDQRSSLPALIYLSFCLLFPDMVSLSAVVLGNTFLLLTIYFMISYIKETEHQQPLFWIGWNASIAFLFYAPYILLLPGVLLVLALYSPIDARKFVTIVYAFILPSILVWVYYFWNDASVFYTQFFLQRVFSFQANHFLSFQHLLWIVAIPLFWLLIGFIAIARASSFVNFQYRVIQSLFLLFFFALLGFLLVKERSVFTIWQIVPYVSAIASYFLLLQKRRWFADFVLLLTFGALFFIRFELKKEVAQDTSGKESRLSVKFNESEWKPFKHVHSVLVLDNNISAYSRYRLSTPFLNWNLSESYFQDMDGYEAVSLLGRYFTKEQPDVIVDPNGVLPKTFYRLPLLANKYMETKKGFYVLKRTMNAR